MATIESVSSEDIPSIDSYTEELIAELQKPVAEVSSAGNDEKSEVRALYEQADNQNLTGPIIDLFARLLDLRRQEKGCSDDFDISGDELQRLAVKHQQIDEHMVSVGGRLQAFLAAGGLRLPLRRVRERRLRGAPLLLGRLLLRRRVHLQS